MDALILMLVVFTGYIMMYRIRDKFLSKKTFKLNKEATAPSKEFEDGVDYVQKKVFCHHFASIADI